MYFSHKLFVYFWSLSCVNTNFCLTICVPDRIAWCSSMRWYPIRFNLPFTWCKSLTLQLAKAHNIITDTLGLVWYWGLQRFHQLFSSQRPSYLTEIFQTLIRPSKRLHSTAQLSSICALSITGAISHCFASAIVFFLTVISAIYASFTESSHSVCRHFFTTLVQLFRNV